MTGDALDGTPEAGNGNGDVAAVVELLTGFGSSCPRHYDEWADDGCALDLARIIAAREAAAEQRGWGAGFDDAHGMFCKDDGSTCTNATHPERAQQAVAWDEGYYRGVRDEAGDMERADNPYHERADRSERGEP